MKILLIEDDEILGNLLLETLTSQRYIVERAEDGQLGWEYAQSSEYDLILIDVGLPKLDGISLCQRIRSEGYSTPILLMTAQEAPRDRVRGLDAGADDYLIKPIDLEELLARVRALLRRGEVLPTTVIEIGTLILNPTSCQVTYRDKLIPLTPKEYTLLELLMRNPTRVFSRGQIIEHLWTFDDPPQEDSVKAHIKGLRQKLKAAGAVDWIENVYGLGYRLSPKIESTPPDKTEEFAQARDRLWEQYSDLMLQRLAVLQEAGVALSSQNLLPELRLSATQAAHKLAGVLGMFERQKGSEIAKEIEQLMQGDSLISVSQIQQLLRLIQQLERQVQPISSSQSLSGELLLIDTDTQLAIALQPLAQKVGTAWEQVSSLAAAKDWLKVRSPHAVVLSLEEGKDYQESLTLLRDLSQRTPPIPVLTLAPQDSLSQRVLFARAGGQGFLVKPVSAEQVWTVALRLLESHRASAIRVLVVDDDPAFLGALKSLLQPWGMQVTGLENPLDLWNVLEQVSPDLLLLDVEMPQMGGIELCQAIRTDPNWQSLPILFLTSHRDIETIQQIFQVGADDYIVKPVVGPELLSRITHRLERTRLLQNQAYPGRSV